MRGVPGHGQRSNGKIDRSRLCRGTNPRSAQLNLNEGIKVLEVQLGAARISSPTEPAPIDLAIAEPAVRVPEDYYWINISGLNR